MLDLEQIRMTLRVLLVAIGLLTLLIGMTVASMWFIDKGAVISAWRSPGVWESIHISRIIAWILMSVVCVAGIWFGDYIAAFSALATLCIIRTASLWVRRDTWGFEQMRRHIAGEAIQHSAALLCVSAALTIQGLLQLHSLGDGPRISISVSLLLAGLVAVNKSMTRTRKICTEVSKQASSLLKLFAKLHAAHGDDPKATQTESARAECIEGIDTFARALDTRLNTGYRRFGAPFLPAHTYQRVIAELRQCARTADPNTQIWLTTSHKLRLIRQACAPWTDAVA
ncbi:hypothetical protein ACIF6L_02045 [Kitasatospora sp. NPDC086009]|uniref:hypothetical protein n=1 Tax=unclassified Kitasatospora TaxID=2633591 RepID=UPI0037CA6B8B